MTSFNPPFEWENFQGSNISSIDENDFMMLLQKQFPVMAAANGPPTEPTSNKSDSAAAKTQPPSKFQLSNSTSPLSSDSSPSPASARDDAASLHSGDGNNGNSGSNRNDDETHKRKASGTDFDDDIGGQPYTKTQHIDQSDRSKKAQQASRRKSGGGEKSQDETRLMKRKEQNRAAQRAFRERKEKHVKDLEDKVAELEAKTESQAAENDNLRDMLSRLQNENTVLKQAAFTFTVPNSVQETRRHVSASQSPVTTSAVNMSPPMNLFGGSSEAGPSRLPSGSISSPSNHESPNSLFDRFDNFTSLNNVGSPSGASTSSQSNAAPASTSTPDMDTMAVFGSSGPSFTTIASNPMFMSYYDPIQSMNAFASFGGWDNDTTMANNTTTHTNDNQGLDGLFGDQLSGLIPLNGDFLSDGKSPSHGGASPIAHNNVNTNEHNKNECPKTKADVERYIASGPKGTFGSPVSTPSPHRDPNAMITEQTVNEYDVAFQEALGKAKPVGPPGCDSYNIDELCLEMQRKAKCTMGIDC